MGKDREKLIASIPPKTGVYLMKDSSGKVIYIGKALNLRSRVRSYFRETGDDRSSIPFLRNRLTDIDFILTDSEKEALILENNLIKQHKPKYNIRLRDDKDYLCLRLTTKEKYPRLITLRRPKSGSEPTFGPYSSASELKETLRILRKAFPLRTCSPAVFRSRNRPCLNYQLGRCLAPCTLPVSEAEYNSIVNEVRMILSGRAESLLDDLREKMGYAAEDLRFEDAAIYRDRIGAVAATIERQKMFRTGGPARDVIGTARKADRVAAARMRIREGKVVSVDNFFFNAHGKNDKDVLDEFLSRLYGGDGETPREISIPVAMKSSAAIAEWLSEKSGSKVYIKVPKRGEGRAMIELAVKNAAEALESEFAREFDSNEILEQLGRRLELGAPPQHIEGIDISNISGKLAVGSLVVFIDAAPEKSRYRKYKITGMDEPNDYAMMKQVLERRVRRGIEEDNLPDLILIDGGKGQLNIAREVLRELDAPHVALASMAKDREGVGSDRVFIPGRKNPVSLPTQAFHLLQRVRDEAHRFAIEYHRRLRRKTTIASELTKIPGIGPSKRDALLKHFGSLKRVREASRQELLQVKGISRRESEAVYRFFQNETGEENGGAT